VIRICPLKNKIQDYAWGSRSAIQDLLGLPEESRKGPMAELWMGAHPVAPSSIFISGAWESLEKAVEKNPVEILGREVADLFQGKLPFLFKVLAAAKPLSIQVHPGKEQAVEGYDRENRAGLDLKDPERTYKDDSHKPELICALTPFTALKGFRPVQESLNLLQMIVPETLQEELERFRREPNAEGLKGFYKAIMTLDKDERERVTSEAMVNAKNSRSSDESFSWVGRLVHAYPGDIGILSPALMNFFVLSPGEALYLGSNELHAYLDGVGIEVMANSDNVIRGGLTPKHVDVPELLRSVDFTPEKAQPVLPERSPSGVKIYPCPAREFLLSSITLSPGSGQNVYENNGIEIFLCLEGEGKFLDTDTGDEVPFSKGGSVLVSGAVAAYCLEGEAELYRVSVPPPTSSS
jgi:mannose-6-phosphate isomerase